VLNFHALASGDSNIDLEDGCLSDNTATEIPAAWVGDSVTVTRADGRGSTGGVGTPTYYIKTDLFGIEKSYRISYTGKIQEMIEATSADGMLTVNIPKGTIVLDKDGKRLKSLLAAVSENPPSPPGDAHIIGLAYIFEPSGTTFNSPITFTWSYDPDALHENVAEEDLVIAYYDDNAGKWVELDCVVDIENNVIIAPVEHLTTFAAIYYLLAPPDFTISNLTISPSQCEPEQEITITATVTNTGGTAGDYSVELRIDDLTEASQSLSLAPGASETAGFTVKKSKAGSYQVDINGLPGAFEVKEKPGLQETPFVPTRPEPINWLLIGEVIAAVAVAVGLVYFFLIRKRYGGTAAKYPAVLGTPVGAAIAGGVRFLLRKCKLKKGRHDTADSGDEST